MIPVFQSDSFLRLGNTNLRNIHLPDNLSLTVHLLNFALSASYQNIALRQFLNRPRLESAPAFEFLALAVVLADAAKSHVGNKKSAARCQPGIAELSVNRAFLVCSHLKLAHDAFRRNLHHHNLCRLSVLHKNNVRSAYRLHGMNLASLRCVVVPHAFSAAVNLGYSKLMRHQNVSVVHQDGIANLALQPLRLWQLSIVVSPRYGSILHLEHSQALTLPCIEKVVAR